MSAAELAGLIRSARSVVALTGAGISVPSGIPDFRTPGTGIWEKVDPMEVAHIDVFRRDPVRFWGFYGDRFHSLDQREPNGAHRVGLANQVVPDHELFDTALAWARRLAEKAPIAIEEIKKRSGHGDLDEGLAAEAEGFARALRSEDAREGIGAFLGKRRPRFRGR